MTVPVGEDLAPYLHRAAEILARPRRTCVDAHGMRDRVAADGEGLTRQHPHARPVRSPGEGAAVPRFGSSSQAWGEAPCVVASNLCSISAIIVWRRRNSALCSATTRSTRRSSIRRVPTRPARGPVLQQSMRSAAAMPWTNAGGATTAPSRRPGAMHFEKPLTCTVMSGSVAAKAGADRRRTAGRRRPR